MAMFTYSLCVNFIHFYPHSVARAARGSPRVTTDAELEGLRGIGSVDLRRVAADFVRGENRRIVRRDAGDQKEGRWRATAVG